MPRHLPVLQTPPPEDAEASARSPWNWVLIGAGFTITLWLPLATLASYARSFWLVALSFVLASLLSGVLVGRFGVRARLHHVALGGFFGGLLGLLLAALGGAVTSPALALGSLLGLGGGGAACALGGGVLGRALRRRGK